MYTFPVALRLLRRRHTVHLLHAHFIFPQGLFGLLLARICGLPFVISTVGDDVNVMLRRNAILRTVSRFVLARADVIIAVSIPLQNVLKEFGIANTIYLPNSVDTTAIGPNGELPKTGSILFVGSMTANKRPLVLLRAFERVVAKFPNATLTMVGDGPLRQAVQDRIRRYQLDRKIRLIPVATPKFVIELLLQAEVFVLPSESEGLSNALLEAMATGRVIVASSNESHREILRDGIDALLFRVDDEKELADQILSVLTDEKLRLRLSRSARELCLRQFSAGKIGPELERIYSASAQ
jgi:glycosyltransferase involved in cell wall biosynthesis